MSAAVSLSEPMTADEIRDARRRVLTDRQLECLALIRESIASLGYPPTLREIGSRMGIGSTNGVNDHLRALERKGYIRRDGGTARGIVVVDESGGEMVAKAIEDWKRECNSLRLLLGRVADAGTRLPSLSSEFALLLGDVRAVLGRRDQ